MSLSPNAPKWTNEWIVCRLISNRHTQRPRQVQERETTAILGDLLSSIHPSTPLVELTWVHWSMVKSATSQNGDTDTATEMVIVKTATNPNNTYSSSEACIIDHRLYTYMACNCWVIWKKYNIPSRAVPDVSSKQIWARDILLTNDCTAKTA